MTTNRATYNTIEDVIRGMNRLSNEIKQANTQHAGNSKKMRELYVKTFSPGIAELRDKASELEEDAKDKHLLVKLATSERELTSAAAKFVATLESKNNYGGKMFDHPTPIADASALKTKLEAVKQRYPDTAAQVDKWIHNIEQLPVKFPDQEHQKRNLDKLVELVVMTLGKKEREYPNILDGIKANSAGNQKKL